MCPLALVFSPVAILPYLFHFYKKSAIPISKITRENTAHIRKSEGIGLDCFGGVDYE
jgi:hypothetical protein